MSLFAKLIGDQAFGSDRPPLTHKERSKLSTSRPAFVDYLPFVDFHEREKLFLFDDGCSCGAIFSLRGADMEARTEDLHEEFNKKICNLFSNLPRDEEYPYVVQMYLTDEEPVNLGDALQEATTEGIRESNFSQSWFDIMRVHSNMMTNPDGIFPDSRTNGAKGWRALKRSIYLCVFRHAPEKVWLEDCRHTRSTPFAFFNRQIKSFEQSLDHLGFHPQRLDHHGLRRWLMPWLTPNPAGKPKDMRMPEWLRKHPLPDNRRDFGAAWDLGQIICEEPPIPLEKEVAERGILDFGGTYSRFVTLQGVMHPPRAGAVTADHFENERILASMWDRMPAQSVFCWTIVPLPAAYMESKLNNIEVKAKESGSRYGRAAFDQVDAAHHAIVHKTDEIFYYQAGIYLFSDSLQELEDKYFQALSLIDHAGFQRPIREEHDLFPTDSYVRNLPMVFSWKHDREHARRCTLTYSSHVAAVSPFYGRSAGSENPCFITYNRAGEIFQMNPYHKRDRDRTAHTLIFGPTGAGKSATVVALAMQSMGVNRPRQFFVDKGGSFALLCDFYEAKGLKVKRMIFQPNQDACLPPYFESAKALAQFRNEGSEGTETLPSNDDLSSLMNDGDDQRDYISGMLAATQLMITGGKQKEIEDMTRGKVARIQKALRMALEYAEKEQKPHALPEDVMHALLQLSKQEKDSDIAKDLRAMADAMDLWTSGPRGKFFNRYAEGFSDDDDVTLIEMGALTDEGSEDMLAVAVMALMSNVTGLGERHQHGSRHTEVWIDEAHYVTQNRLLVDGTVKAVKVWRKLGIWLHLATQNTDDFPDYARKILLLVEFWWLLQMPGQEVERVAEMKGNLTEEHKAMMLQCQKETPNFIECVMLSAKFPPALLRQIHPAAALAFGMTEQHEKQERYEIMQQHHCTELEAALMIADQIIQKRIQNAPSHHK